MVFFSAFERESPEYVESSSGAESGCIQMSTLILIRHGQASFGSVNYDQLSEMGIAQSAALGEYWAARGRIIDAVFCGAQVRQKHTFEIVREKYRLAGLPFPEPISTDAFNEYDAFGIMAAFYPRLLDTDPRLQDIVNKMPRLGDSSPEGRKAFQKSFEIVLDCWLEGALEVDGVETFNHFRRRVVEGVEKIIASYESGKTVAVFTSGGAISMALGYALDIPVKS